MKNKTCCFTGHRRLPADSLPEIRKTLGAEIDRLCHQGVTDFISGGALGFDQIAASLVICRKRAGVPIRLLLALPCRDQDKGWTVPQKLLYQEIKNEADEIICLSGHYTQGCMQRRNRYMVDRSGHCLCYLRHSRSGAGQTVRYAQAQGLQIKNILP